MTTLTLDELLERVDRAPRLPDTALELLKVLSDPCSTIEEIVGCVRYDPAVTAEMLRLCNSALYGLSRKVHSLDAAICLLGTTRLLQLVVATYVKETLMDRPQEGYGLPPGALWDHAVGVGLASQRLAQEAGLREIGACFTAGLLHDLGKVVLNRFVVEEYAEITRLVRQGDVSFSEAERQVLGFTHEEVGAHLAERWRLPEALVRAIRHHHTPDDLAPPDVLTDLVHLADATCLMIGIGGGEVDGLSYRIRPHALARRGLTAHHLELAGVEVAEEMRRIRALCTALQ